MKKDLTTWGIEQANEIIASIKTQMPLMTDAIVEVSRFDALSNLFRGLIFLSIIVFITLVSVRLLNKAYTYCKSEGWDLSDTIFALSWPYLVLLIADCLLFIEGYNLFRIWNWVGLFQPKLYLAHQIIEKVLK